MGFEPRGFDGPLIRVDASGKGRDLVLIHGLAASPETWQDAPERLAVPARRHLVHMRGFAGLPDSPARQPGRFLSAAARDVADYIRSHSDRPVAVLGHSMGGIVTLILARDYPELIDRAMVVDVPAFFSALISPFATASGMSGLAELSRRRWVGHDEPAFEETLRRSAPGLVRDPVMQERIVHWGLTSSRAATADVMAEVMVTDLRADLPRITAPVDVLYAWDRSSAATRPGLDQVYANTYSGLRRCNRLRMDDARHYVMFDQPTAFWLSVDDWLAR